MSHYVCPNCHGVSDVAKSCDTPGCTRHGKPLVACECADNQHQGIASDQADTDTASPASQ